MRIIILTILLSHSILSSAVISCPVTENKLAVYFSNGMFNDRQDAENSLKNLKKLPIMKSGKYTLNFGISYNQNEPWHYQILEVFRQRQLEQWSLFYRWLSGLEIAPNWFQQAMKEATLITDAVNYIFDEDLNNHISNYKSEIEACKSINYCPFTR